MSKYLKFVLRDTAVMMVAWSHVQFVGLVHTAMNLDLLPVKPVTLEPTIQKKAPYLVMVQHFQFINKMSNQ